MIEKALSSKRAVKVHSDTTSRYCADDAQPVLDIDLKTDPRLDVLP